MGIIDIDAIDDEVSDDEKKLHEKVDKNATHKPSLSAERNSGIEKRKKPGKKAKYSGNLVQLNFSRVPEPAKFAFTEFCAELRLLDRKFSKLSNQDVLLMAMRDFGIPIDNQFITDSVLSDDNRTIVINKTILNIENNKDS